MTNNTTVLAILGSAIWGIENDTNDVRLKTAITIKSKQWDGVLNSYSFFFLLIPKHIIKTVAKNIYPPFNQSRVLSIKLTA